MLTATIRAHCAPLERTAINVQGYKHHAPTEHFATEVIKPKPLFGQSHTHQRRIATVQRFVDETLW
jgi:hypothetical protein